MNMSDKETYLRKKKSYSCNNTQTSICIHVNIYTKYVFICIRIIMNIT